MDTAETSYLISDLLGDQQTQWFKIPESGVHWHVPLHGLKFEKTGSSRKPEVRENRKFKKNGSSRKLEVRDNKTPLFVILADLR